jgi:DNA-binding GntR family transcriptional regulator
MIPATLGAQVTARILEMIASGELVAGQRLVEPAIAARLNVGTVPVREALRVLAGDGVLDIVPHKGATLRLMGAKEIRDTMNGIVGLLLVALEELEGRPTPSLLPGLKQAARLITAGQRRGDAFEILTGAADYQLHFIRASGNDYIERNIRKTHFAYYNKQLVRFITAADLAGICASYALLTDYAAAQNWRAAGQLFKHNAGLICALLDQRGAGVNHQKNSAPK